MCRQYAFRCQGCERLLLHEPRLCKAPSCALNSRLILPMRHPQMGRFQCRRCLWCWSSPESKGGVARARQILQGFGDDALILPEHWKRLSETPEGDYLRDADFTSIATEEDAEVFAAFTAVIEADLVVRFHDSKLRTPSEFELEIVAKMLYVSYDDWIDRIELDHKDIREERTEIILERGKIRTGEGATCPNCFNEYCEPRGDPRQFEFFRSFHRWGQLLEFDLPAFLDDELGEEDLGGDFLEEQPCLTPCNHLVGHRCLRKWLMNKVSRGNDCPLCRHYL